MDWPPLGAHLKTPYDRALAALGIQPVLVDIGASGAPPTIWEPIAPHSIYVGFDPDRRDLHEVTDTPFYRATIVNKAVTGRDDAGDALFYLTRSPHCSSTLEPDAPALSNFLFSELFVVEKETQVPTTTLDAALEQVGLARVDWLKTDSQGIDLRLFNSLRAETRARVLAVDVEPGLIDAYVGEDLFIDAQRELTRIGFWLSNLTVRGDVRLRRSTLRELMQHDPRLDERLISARVRRTPGWCEARYLRTIQSLVQTGCSQREYVLLWVFALLDHQIGFALDLAVEYERQFGTDDVSQLLKDEPLRRLTRSRARQWLGAVRSLLRSVVSRARSVY